MILFNKRIKVHPFAMSDGEPIGRGPDRAAAEESERPIVAVKRGNARRAKGPWLFRVWNGRKQRRRLDVARQPENVRGQSAGA